MYMVEETENCRHNRTCEQLLHSRVRQTICLVKGHPLANVTLDHIDDGVEENEEDPHKCQQVYEHARDGTNVEGGV